MSGVGTELADLHLPIRVCGDLALFQALGSLLVAKEDAARAAGRPGTVLDLDFIRQHTTGFEAWADHVRSLDWDAVDDATGLDRTLIEQAAELLATSKRTVTCWAMGITQHRNAVATIKEFANLAFAQGNIGKPGAGLCPVRGHSNVQGDRTMGIWESVPDHFLDALRDEFHFEPPREHGYDTVDAVRALRDRKARVFVGMGGNFAVGRPRHRRRRGGDARCRADGADLHQAQPVARRLPAGPRSSSRCWVAAERDRTGGRDQRITVEDSMSAVHASRGPLAPASPHLRSEVDVVCGMAVATVPGVGRIPWADFRADYRLVREAIGRVVPGLRRIRREGRPARRIRPAAPAARHAGRSRPRPGSGIFTVSPTDVLHVPEGRLLLQSLRSHDQYNTTIYGLEDRYRGIHGGRRVVFVNPLDIVDLGVEEGEIVDLVSEWRDGSERVAPAVPGRALRHPARMRGRVLPGGEPAGAAGLHGDREQLPDLEVGHRPAGPPTGEHAGGDSSAGARRRVGRRPQVRRGAVPPQLSGCGRVGGAMSHEPDLQTDLATLAARTVMASFDGVTLPDWARRRLADGHGRDLPVRRERHVARDHPSTCAPTSTRPLPTRSSRWTRRAATSRGSTTRSAAPTPGTPRWARSTTRR